jgi:hypothetical protein
MKKLILVCCALQCIFLSACWHHHGDISFNYKDNPDNYSMDAWFGQSKTRAAEQYMDRCIGRQNNMSFLNFHSDAVFTLQDGSKFYMKKSPGHILIKMKKDETSDEAYHMVKDMCKGMKDVVLK